jgi:hypothetical protein
MHIFYILHVSVITVVCVNGIIIITKLYKFTCYVFCLCVLFLIYTDIHFVIGLWAVSTQINKN